MKSILLAIFFFILPSYVFPQTPAPSASEPISIILNEWTSQVILSKITGKILMRMGYPVQYHRVDSHQQWGGLHRGYYHLQMEIWEGTQKEVLEHMLKKGGILPAGTHEAKAREDWWYPSYVEDFCPGLPNWEALKTCSEIFATPETYPKGMYLTGPWEKFDKIRIRALDLNFKVVRVESADILRNHLEKAVQSRTPILLLNWTPGWVEARYEGKFVEFPAYDPKCETTPGWGVNPDYIQDCGTPRNGWLKKAVWSGVKDRWPCAFKTITNISFSNKMISDLVYMVDVGGSSPDNAAEHWVIENEKLWKSWIPADCPNRTTGR